MKNTFTLALILMLMTSTFSFAQNDAEKIVYDECGNIISPVGYVEEPVTASLKSTQVTNSCYNFADTFEGSTTVSSQWQLNSSAAYSIATTDSPEGNNHLVQAGGGVFDLTKCFFTPSTPAYVSYRVKINTTEPGAYFILGNVDIAMMNDCIAFCYFQKGNFILHNGAPHYYPANINQWYFIELKNIDYIKRKFDLWIDGVLKDNGLVFRGVTIRSASMIALSNFNETKNVAEYDDFYVSSNITSPTVACADNQNLTVNSGQTSYTVNGTEFDPTIDADACSVKVTNSFNNLATLADAVLSLGTTKITWTVTDKAGNASICQQDISVSVLTDIEHNGKDQVFIFPNPTSDDLNLNCASGVFNIIITDVLGKTVWSGSASEFPLSVSSFAKGIYLVNVVTEDGVKNEKVIIK